MAIADFLLEDGVVSDFVPIDLFSQNIRVVRGGWKGGGVLAFFRHNCLMMA